MENRGECMSQKKRIEQIKELLHAHNEISLEDIMEKFQVSRDTARRDLVRLEEDGDIVRVKRGAILSSQHSRVTRYQERNISQEKEHIAQTACSFIHDGDTILFDTSTTVELTARYMSSKDVTAITNSIDIVTNLSERSDITVYMVGGKFNPHNRNFVGLHTVEELAKYQAHTLFIGACGIGTGGLTSPDEGEAYVKKSMMRASQRVIVLTEYTKFQKTFLHKVCGLEEIDIIITNQAPPPEIEQQLYHYNIELIVTNKNLRSDYQ